MPRKVIQPMCTSPEEAANLLSKKKTKTVNCCALDILFGNADEAAANTVEAELASFQREPVADRNIVLCSGGMAMRRNTPVLLFWPSAIYYCY